MKPPEYNAHPPETTSSQPLILALRVAGALGILAILLLSLMPGDLQAPLRSGLPGEVEHLTAYAAVACCLRGGFTGRGSSIWIIAGLASLAGLLELLQGLVAGRGPAISDAVAGAAGAWAGAYAGAVLRRVVIDR